MPINNISDWLSFLNERITSYEATQNSLLTFIEVILTLAVALIGITVAITPSDKNFFNLTGQWVIIFLLLGAGIISLFLWRHDKKSLNMPYQNALQIRRAILEGTLTNPDDIYSECLNARILMINVK